MKSKAMAIMGILAGLGAACGSKTGIKTIRDGSIDLGTGNGGVLGVGGSNGTGGATAVGTGGTTVVGTGGKGVGGSLDSGGGTGTGTGGISLASGGSPGNGGAGSGGSRLDGGQDTGGPAIDGAIDAPLDGAIDAGPSVCESLPGGACTSIVMGCAVCPSGSFANPTRAGCSDYSWCCTNETPTGSACSSTDNGVCVGLGNSCPDGWVGVWMSCGSSDLKCCIPQTGVCPAYPKQCAEIGGVCTESSWDNCPVGTEPYALGSGNQLGCESKRGWCCVDAPPSSCTDTDELDMCIPGAECPGCYHAVDAIDRTCEAGRVCCYNVCD